MKLNEATYISGEKVILLPYKEHHVLRYHRWMQSSELQQLTASQPLTLQQEFAMQQSWHDDEKKCTFIILDAEQYGQNAKNEIDAMIGDVNLFFNDEDNPHSAEVEIMIAEPINRCCGCGYEALMAMLNYGATFLKVIHFTAKISYSNLPSLHLFQKIAFTEVSRSDIFQEVTLQLSVTKDTLHWLSEQTKHLKLDERNK